jgi:AcrR family transcriptional regulator
MAGKTDGRQLRWDSHNQARRQHILDAAIGVLADAEPGAEAHVQQIADRAGLSRTVVYRHFADKTDLYLAVCERVATVLVDQLREAMREVTEPARTLRAGIDAYLGLIEADPDVYRYVMRPPRLDRPVGGDGTDPVSHLTTLIGDHVGEVISVELRRQGRDPTPAATWGHALVGMVRAAADQWLGARPDVAREVLARQLADLAWDGLSRTINHAAQSA